MGKLMDRYMAEYRETVLPGLGSRDLYVVRPEAWLALKWETDNHISPFDPEYEQRLKLLQDVDLELAEKITAWNKFMIG